MQESLLAAWRTNNNVTMQLIESLPRALWEVRVPGGPRTVRAIAAHLHNSRCAWIRTLGTEHGIAPPEQVDRYKVTPRQVVAALKRSGRAMEKLLILALEHDGVLPPSKRYVWRNLALDVGHVLTYFVGHEAHHRGQIVMLARESGHRIPKKAVDALWWWK